jgi:hypothetical protein
MGLRPPCIKRNFKRISFRPSSFFKSARYLIQQRLIATKKAWQAEVNRATLPHPEFGEHHGIRHQY